MADEGILDDPYYVETDNGILDDPNYVDDDGILDDPDYLVSTSLDDAGIIDDPEYNQFTEIDKEELGIIDDDQGVLDDPNYNPNVNSDYNTTPNSNCNDKTEGSDYITFKAINEVRNNVIPTEDADKNENINFDIDNDGQLSDRNTNTGDATDTWNASSNENDNLCNLSQSKNLAELGIIDDDYEITIEKDNTNADERFSLSKSDNMQYPTAVAAQDFHDANIIESDAANAKNEIPTPPTNLRNSRTKEKVTDKEANTRSNSNSKNINQTNFRPKIITGRKIKEDKANVEFSKKSSSNSTRNDEKNIPNVSLTVSEAGVDDSINRLRSETVVIDKRNADDKNKNEGGETVFLKNSLSSSSKPKRQRSHSDVGENVVNDEEVDKEITEGSKKERRNTLSRSSNISPPRNLKLQKRPLLPSKLPAMKSPTATSPPFSNKPTIKKSSSAVALHTDKISQPKQSSTTSLSPSPSPSPRSRLKHTTSASQLPSRMSKARTDTSEKKSTSSNDHIQDATTAPNESKNTTKKTLSARHSVHGLSTNGKTSPRVSNSNKSVSNPNLLGEKSKRPATASNLSLGRFSRSTTNLSIKGNLSKDKEMEDLEKELRKTKAQMTEAKLEASQAIEEAHFLAAKAVEEIKLETSNQIKQAKQQAEQDLLQLKFDTDKEIFQLTHLYKHQKQNSQNWRKIAQKSNTATEAMATVIQVLQNKIELLEKKAFIEIRDGEENLSEIDRLKLRQQEAIKRLKESRMIMLKDVNVQHAKKMASLEAKHQISMSQLKRAHGKEILKMENKINKSQKEHEEQIQQIRDESKTSQSLLEDESFNLCNEIATLKDKLHELERTSNIDHDQRVQDALEKYENMPQELDSLKTVLELKFQEINQLKTEKQEIANQLLLNNQTKKYIKNLELRNEELEAIVNAKIQTEKENLSKITNLQEDMNALKREKNRLRLEIEQLRWKAKST